MCALIIHAHAHTWLQRRGLKLCGADGGDAEDFSGRARLQCPEQDKAPDELTAQFADVQGQTNEQDPKEVMQFHHKAVG